MKNNKTGYLIISIIFIVFSLVSFFAFTEKNSLFYSGYIFSVISFVVMDYAFRKNFQSKVTINSRFLNLPIIYIASIYVITQIILFYVLMVMEIPFIACLIIYIILLGFNLILLISTEAGIKVNEKLENKIQEKKNYLKDIEIDLELLVKKEKLENNKKLLNLIEMIKYSDPMSHDSLVLLEEEIKSKVEELKNSKDKDNLIEEIELLLEKRNKKVKVLKK